LSLADILHSSEIKEENKKLKKENEQMRAYLNKAVEIKKENDRLKTYFEQIQGMDYIKINEEIAQLKADKNRLTADKDKLSQELKQVNAELQEKGKNLLSADDDIMFETFALYKPHFSFQTSAEYKQRLDGIRDKQKSLIKSDWAALSGTEWTVNNSKVEGTKMVKDLKKLLIRSFNNECDYCVDNVKFNNHESSEKRITVSFDILNKLGKFAQVSLSNEYKKLKFDELYLAYEYQMKKQEEKEELGRKREEIREQQKLEREIEAAREKIAKERKHYTQAISELTQRILSSTDEQELNDLNLKLEKLQGERAYLDDEEKLIDYREKNAKAGYIYIISNIGAFGKDVFKIGMTRRLEPNERIYELGDASVPFPFDTHALIFSYNAPELEAKIHQHFHKNRLNKINNRREFFTADIDELEQVIRENYDKIVDFVKIPPAEQYRESLLIGE
jgi:hypothetical protein